MRKNFIYFFLIASMISHTAWANNEPDHPKPAVKLVREIRGKAAEKIAKKYHLKHLGEGASMPNCVVRTIHLHFIAYRSLTRDETRKLLLDCAQDFLAEINTHPELAKYAPVFPFKMDNIEITIACQNTDGNDPYDPDIGFAAVRDGYFMYRTFEKSDQLKIKSTDYELYENVVAKVQSRQ